MKFTSSGVGILPAMDGRDAYPIRKLLCTNLALSRYQDALKRCATHH